MAVEGVDFLLADDFAEALAALTGAGWIITSHSRYNPTHVDGLTPTGKTFTLDASGTAITLTIAGRVHVVTVASVDQWLQGSKLIAQWQAAYALFPKAQQ